MRAGLNFGLGADLLILLLANLHCLFICFTCVPLRSRVATTHTGRLQQQAHTRQIINHARKSKHLRALQPKVGDEKANNGVEEKY